MPPEHNYELAAQRLADEVGEGFKSVRKEDLRNALRGAGHPTGALGGKNVLPNLEQALDEKGILTHPPLTATSRMYRLYHRHSIVADLVRDITVPSVSADKKLKQYADVIKAAQNLKP